MGYFNRRRKFDKKIPGNEQVELLSMVDGMLMAEGEPKVHAHAVLGQSDGSTQGGHPIEAQVRPMLELVLVDCRPISEGNVSPSLA